MCYAKPGPRCSSHAKEILDQRAREYQQTAGRKDWDGARRAYAAWQEAQEEYNATPAGMKELEQQLASAARMGFEPEAISDRLEAAKLRREQALIAYKRAHPNKNLPAADADVHTTYQTPYYGARAAEASKWSPLKVISEVKKEIRRAQEENGLPEGLKLSLLPTDLTGNFRLTVRHLPPMTEAERKQTLSTLRGIATVFAERHRQPNWNAPMRTGEVHVKQS